MKLKCAYFYRVDASTLWNPLQHSPLRGSPPLRTLLRSWEANSSRLLTLVGWAEGWSRSLTPVFPSSRSTISPPRRHSQSGRLPAAPAPSPSRTQVCNDKEIEIQQISHIRLLSSHPDTFLHCLVWESIRKDSSHCMLLLLHGGNRCY